MGQLDRWPDSRDILTTGAGRGDDDAVAGSRGQDSLHERPASQASVRDRRSLYLQSAQVLSGDRLVIIGVQKERETESNRPHLFIAAI